MDYILNFRYVKEGIVRMGTSLFVKVALTLLVYFHIILEVITFCGIKLTAFVILRNETTKNLYFKISYQFSVLEKLSPVKGVLFVAMNR